MHIFRQFLGLVHDVLWRCHLAAVVQPCGDVQRFPIVVIHCEVAKRPFLGFAGGRGEHRGELRDTLTVSAGIRRFGVDGPRDQLDERLEQLLRAQQILVLDSDRGGTGQCFDKGNEFPW